MKAKITEQVASVIEHYPPKAKSVFNDVRKIVIRAAKESGGMQNTTETLKWGYQDEFTFDGNRAISFPLKGKLPAAALQHCISMSMQYHKIKKLPLLGN